MHKPALASFLAVALALAGCNDRPEMTVEPDPVVTNTTVWARFDRPINGRAVDQYWVVIAPAGAPPSHYSEATRLFVDRSAYGIQLKAPAEPGEYEVRLHGDWPKDEYHLVRTVPLHVLPANDAISAR